MGGVSWDGTELGYIGGPYQITHGVKSTNQYALGKPKVKDASGKATVYGCTDCHGTGMNFFDGGFNMTGTAIPADKTFTPEVGS